jgi:two-component system sensor histidine kinase ChvG
MAVEIEGARPAGVAQSLQRISGGLSGLLGVLVRRVGARLEPAHRLAGKLIALVERGGLYRLMTSGPLVRFVARSLQRRIIVANLIGLSVLLSGIVYFSQYHAWLIDAKRESLRAQGEIIAAAIAANASLDTGRIVLDPDRLPETQGSPGAFHDDAFAALQLSIAPERVTPILRKLVPAFDTRARVYARDGTLISDTADFAFMSRARPTEGVAERAKIRNAWTRFVSWLLREELPVYREIGSANGTSYPEVRMALNGSTTPMLLIDDKGEQIVSVAVPIEYRKAIKGVLLLSTRPGEIDAVLSEERNVILVLALTALAATLFASFLLARTIAGPMRRLSEAAENVSRSISARHELPLLAHRTDEVGQMAAAFRGMTAALYSRVEASERFAQDVAHELRNPLTAARSTAEALAFARTPEQHQRLVREIQDELKRLNKLITDVSNASRLDAELALQATEPVDVRQVLAAVVGVFRDILADDTRRIVLDVAEVPGRDGAYMVLGHDARLGRVITNLLDNAVSFSPEHGVVMVAARRLGGEIEIVVDDQGPGMPGDKLEAIFDRFYSDRPQTDSTIGKNSGLGLSISRDIVSAYGGRIRASNRCAAVAAGDGREVVAGARFVVHLPAADAAPAKGAPLLARRN